MMHIQEEYAGLFWNPLAKELAQWYRDEISRINEAMKCEHPPTPVSP
jgi:hypothetical protein